MYLNQQPLEVFSRYIQEGIDSKEAWGILLGHVGVARWAGGHRLVGSSNFNADVAPRMQGCGRFERGFDGQGRGQVEKKEVTFSRKSIRGHAEKAPSLSVRFERRVPQSEPQ